MLKNTIVLLVMLSANFGYSQNLSSEEQKKILNDLREMKEKINRLENKSPSGLKKTNYANETTDKNEEASASPEDTKKLMNDLNAVKLKQAESQKILDELEKDE